MKKPLGASWGAAAIAAGLAFAAPTLADQPPPTHPMAQEHPIEFDATGIIPPMPWSIPGVTEPIQSVRDRMATDKVTTLKLRRGRYIFMTTVFSFEFTVNLEGKLAELDINPLMVLPEGQGVKAVDALAVVKTG